MADDRSRYHHHLSGAGGLLFISGVVGGLVTCATGVVGALFLFIGLYALFTQGLPGQIVGTVFVLGMLVVVVKVWQMVVSWQRRVRFLQEQEAEGQGNGPGKG